MNAIEIYENAIRMFELNGEITLGEFEDMIKPLEDVAPVVHGEWIKGVCDKCGFDWGKVVPIAGVPSYCPNCGAKMDKGDDAK